MIAEESSLATRRYVPGDRGIDDVVRIDVNSLAYWLHGDEKVSVYAVMDAAGQVVER